jgi:chromosome segregation ATPase
MTDVAATMDRNELERSIKAISDEIASLTVEIFALQEKLDELKWQRIDLRSVLHGG